METPPPTSTGSAAAAVPHDPYIALRFPNFRRFFVGNAFSLFGTQMAGAAIQWEIFARTNSYVALGLVGLVQIIPIVALALPAGHIVDRFNRRSLVLAATTLLVVSYTLMGLSSRFAVGHASGFLQIFNDGLAWISQRFGEPQGFVEHQVHFVDAHIPILFFLLLINGMARAFNQPAKQSLLPALLPPDHFANGVTWNATAFETSNVVGPMVAGFVVALLAGNGGNAGGDQSLANHMAYASIYWFNAACQAIQFLSLLRVQLRHTPRPRQPMTLHSMLAGARFVYARKVILGTITMDLFAVLLGGATTLLPGFARDILKVGPIGFGWLRAAPSIGALLMAMLIAHTPPMKHAGRNLLLCVAGFGIATIVFGLSRNFWVSLVALFLTGAFDNVSVVVRHSLVQLLTPDDMRGRVNAVNSVFISISNELGGFESGITAAIGQMFWGAIWGPMIAVAAGGVGTLVVVGAVVALWPAVGQVKELRKE